jgi:hypothetical protein
VKKIGIFLKRRFLPLEENHLFHSELAAGTRQRKAEAACCPMPFLFFLSGKKEVTQK